MSLKLHVIANSQWENECNCNFQAPPWQWLIKKGLSCCVWGWSDIWVLCTFVHQTLYNQDDNWKWIMLHQTADRDTIRALGFFVTLWYCRLFCCVALCNTSTHSTQLSQKMLRNSFLHTQEMWASVYVVLALCLEELCELLFGALLPAPCVSECENCSSSLSF